MNSLAGTASMLRLHLRRDRIVLPVWIALSSLPPLGVALGIAKLYPTPAALRGFANECMSNPAIVGMLGPILEPTPGAIVAWRTGVMGMLVGGIPSLLLVVRHTRGEEEKGRQELLEGSVMGRHAGLTAALIVVMLSNLLLAALIAGALISVGLSAAGSIAVGISWAAAGWMFAAIGAVTAQLTVTASVANGLALWLFGGFFILRMVGDSGGERGPLAWVSWLSPLGWTRLTRPFAGERWWVFAMVVGFTAAMTAAAYALASRRELGGGLLPLRAGRTAAAPSLSGPFALAWRLQRGMLFGWIGGFVALGVLLGAVGHNLTPLLDTATLNRWLAQIRAHDPAHAFLRLVIYTLGQVISAYAILAVMKLREEETAIRAEPILATAVSRARWAASHLVFAAAGPALVLTASGLAIGLGYGVVTGNLSHEVPQMLATTLRTLPAVWVMGGIAMLLIGAAPRYANFTIWLVLASYLLLELAWELRQVGQSLFDLSPFAYVHWTLGQGSTASFAGLAVTAAALTAAGMLALGRRDIG
ncbi:MAG TPA: hypothetical protein VGI36_19205 [Candidatus Binataceae bacterium]